MRRQDTKGDLLSVLVRAERSLVMIAKVDKSKCIACGVCEGACPQVFRMGDDWLYEVYTNPIPPEYQDSARKAADACPVDAITID